MRTYTETIVTELLATDFDKTYRGDVGCACGCGGNYYDIDDATQAAEVNRRVKYVLRGVANGEAQFFSSGVEVYNPSETKVTRLYFVDGVSYSKKSDGTFERTEEGPQIMDELTPSEIAYIKNTGLSMEDAVKFTVYQYVRGCLTVNEYAEMYKTWSSYHKEVADKLVLEVRRYVEYQMS